jgi:hypothetical protein
MNSEAELIKALNQLVQTEDIPIEYRLHYDELGNIYLCTMQQHPESTQYVIVTKEEYEQYFKYKVIKGKLKLIDHHSGVKTGLEKSDSGFRVVKGNAALLLNADEMYNDTEYYDYRNN